MHGSPALKRYRAFKDLRDEAPIVPPRPLDELKPLLDAGTLLELDERFATIKEAETRIREYCEIQNRGVVFTGSRKCGFYKNVSAIGAGCPHKEKEGCDFYVKIKATREKAFRVDQIRPHTCQISTLEEAYEGTARCQYPVKILAEVLELRNINHENGKELLLRYTKTFSPYARIASIIRVIQENQPSESGEQAQEEQKQEQEQAGGGEENQAEEEQAEEKEVDEEEAEDGEEQAQEEQKQAEERVSEDSDHGEEEEPKDKKGKKRRTSSIHRELQRLAPTKEYARANRNQRMRR